ncbi:MAG TPA: hypothetical protein VLL52_10310 [Anaerolineae bacterium]|nr:hypothetical protein [Anaerolineae bacterium]
MNQNELPDNLIEIKDPDIDPQAILDQIRQRMHARQQELGYQHRKFPSFNTTIPEEPLDIDYDPNLYHHLHLANKIYAQVETQPLLTNSPATQIPILGSLWKLIRGSAHNLVIFYVNRAVNHHVNTNHHLVNTLNYLTLQNEAQQRTILTLQDEIKSLKQQLEPDN